MTTTRDDGLFVDTNVLIYATRPASPWHSQAIEALTAEIDQGVPIIISPQILREYLAAVTRPAPDNSTTPLADALSNVAAFRSAYRVVDESLAVVVAIETILDQTPTIGRQIHDANIVATMLAHGVRRLLTHNTDDFARFSHLITVVPLVTSASDDIGTAETD
jgi:predicted nucleic acid-binding protein